MDDSAAMLCQISSFKEMLDQVDDEASSLFAIDFLFSIPRRFD